MQPKIGLLQFTPALEPVVLGFRQGLFELGHPEESISYEYRSVDGQPDRLPGALAELLSHGVDLLLACATPAAKAAAARAACPVIFAPVFDPVAAGLVAEAARPGGHVTGVSGMLPGELKLRRLRELLPGLARVAILFSPDDANSPSEVRSLQAAGPALGLEVRPVTAGDPEELVSALPTALSAGEALLLSLDRLTDAELERIAAAAREAGKPLVAHNAAGVRRGALLALESDSYELGRVAAGLAHRILSGEDPAGIAVEYPRKARLILNTAVAEALGYHLPPGVVADELSR
ncbi:MAG: ABC transporter substrate-binding protein [Chitinophagales bacterium]